MQVQTNNKRCNFELSNKERTDVEIEIIVNNIW